MRKDKINELLADNKRLRAENAELKHQLTLCAPSRLFENDDYEAISREKMQEACLIARKQYN